MCKRLGADRGVQQPEPEHFRHQACVGTVVGTTGTEPARTRTHQASQAYWHPAVDCTNSRPKKEGQEHHQDPAATQSPTRGTLTLPT